MDRKSFEKKELQAWIILILLSFMWGSSFILIKKALIAFTPLQVGSARIVLSTAAFLPVFFYYFRRIERSIMVPIIAVGLFGSGFPAFLYAIAQTEISSSITGIINSMTPIFTLLLGILFFRSKSGIHQFSGVVLGLTGTLLLIFMGNDTGHDYDFFHGGIIVVATICYAISANTVGTYLKNVNPLIISALSFVIIGPFVCIYLLSTDFTTRITADPHGMKSLWALLILSIVGTFLANIIYFRLVQLTNALFSTTVSFIIPIVAILWGFWDGETIAWQHFAGMAFILTGIYMIRKGHRP